MRLSDVVVKLTDQQKKFCLHYLSNGLDKYKAAIDAKYSPHMARERGSKLLAKPHIKIYIERAMEQLNMKEMITVDWKMGKLKKIVDLCAPDSAVHKDDIDAKPAISAIAELNKMQGHYSKESGDGPTDEEIAAAKAVLDAAVMARKKEY